MIIFEEEYDDESVGNLQEDLFLKINKLIDEGKLEQDEEFFVQGKYIVQVVFKDER